MRPASSSGIEETVTVDDLVALIGQEWKLRQFLVVLGNPVYHFLQFILGAGGDGQDLRGVLFSLIQQGLQLSKLSGAIGSPVSPIEDQYDILLPAVGGESNWHSIF